MGLLSQFLPFVDFLFNVRIKELMLLTYILSWYFDFDNGVTKLVPKGSVDEYANTVSGNDLLPNGWQAIIWANNDPAHWHIYA